MMEKLLLIPSKQRLPGQLGSINAKLNFHQKHQHHSFCRQILFAWNIYRNEHPYSILSQNADPLLSLFQLESQDVLIKWNSSSRQRNDRYTSDASSEGDDTTFSCSTSSTATTNYVNRRAAYESCNSPTSQFGACYSFVRRALQRFTLSSNTFYYTTPRTSKSSTNPETTTSTSGFATLEDMPIELRNIEENRNQYFVGNKGLANDESFRPENYNSNISTNQSNYSPSNHRNSILSIIKNHITKPIRSNSANKPTRLKAVRDNKLNGFLSHHRFSLPINLSRRRSLLQKSADLLFSQDSIEASEMEIPPIKKDAEDTHRSLDSDEMKILANESMNGIDRGGIGKTGESSVTDISEARDKFDDLIVVDKKDIHWLQPHKTVVGTSNVTSNKREVWAKLLQKSLSSDSLESKHSKQSRQQSSGTDTLATTTTTTTGSTSESSSKCLVAYYSMPELRLLSSWSSSEEEDGTGIIRVNRNKLRLRDLHPITFLNNHPKSSSKVVVRDDSQDTQMAVEDLEHNMIFMDQFTTSTSISITAPAPYKQQSATASAIPSPTGANNNANGLSCNSPEQATFTSAAGKKINQQTSMKQMKEKLQLNLPIQVQRTPSPSDLSSEITDCSGSPLISGSEKTARSLSVEYKPQISPSYRQGLRRFSASPSLLVSKPFLQLVPQCSGHETHPSVDSEESFVTIIPANRSCRGSGTLELGADESDSFMDDVILDIDESSNSITSDEALCENIVRPESEATSASTAATKSLASIRLTSQTSSSSSSSKPNTQQYRSNSSTPSPPANLHRYFHLFKCGELEEVIEQNVKSLHVIKSYYSEHATSWCVVAEKVQVWTIWRINLNLTSLSRSSNSCKSVFIILLLFTFPIACTCY